MSITVLDAILAINPDAKVTVQNNPSEHIYDKIIWEDGTKPISDIDIAAKKAQLQIEYEGKEYQRKRKLEYPSIEDQLDDIYHNGIDGWKATIKAIKDKYPKE